MPEVKKLLEKAGSSLLTLSVYLLALTIPVSIAGDNIAIGLGILGFLLLFVSGSRICFPNVKPLGLFLIPEAFGVLLSKNVLKAWQETSWNTNLVPFFLVYDRLKRGLSLEMLMKLLSFSSVVSVLVLLFEAFTHRSWKSVSLERIFSVKFYMVPVRPVGFFDHPLTAAGVLILLFFLFLGLFFKEKNKLYLITTISLFFGVLLTQSRSYWIGVTIGLILFFSFIFRKKSFIYLPIFFTLVAGLVFSVPSFKNRLKSITDTRHNMSNVIRLIIWRSHLRAFDEKFSLKEKIFGAPVVGNDYCCEYIPESYEAILKKKPPKVENLCDRNFFHCLSHSIYVRYLTDYGVLGVLGYVSFMAYLVVVNLVSFRRFLDPVFAAFSTMYLGFAVAGFFENNFTDSEVKICFMFILGINFYLLSQVKNSTKRGVS
ncbi:O-antigen ligase family protein [Desulfurobacterium atlanticum]|uniref:O-Antigen ligase n=1 Tax=Desulfurobacterium atlanticum TaxID=240169 RepID=A0A239AB95_9BACT|nr:O-antigen ligase family protein [Desulfurobacterium atlanticum]SNR92328.1 O-Antigen ligase [Desulfurobacterium atlanticum]